MSKMVPSSKGFTLIEMLLVIVVMAIMASLMLASISDNPLRQLEREAQRLQASLKMAADEAVLQSRELGLALTTDPLTGEPGYQFVWLDFNTDESANNPVSASGKWQPLINSPLSFYPLSDNITIGIELLLELRGDQFSLQIDRLQSASDSQLKPGLLLFSNGETTPFELTVSSTKVEQVVVLTSDGLTGIELL
jgi:general secretion pathway protein H